MARSHARVKVEAWEAGGDFRRLTLEAQWAYVMLISQPEINNCGVLPYRPERWLEFADGLTRRALNRALRQLVAHRFVIVDERTRELVVRSFVKHDRIEAQPNLVTSALRQFREIESPLIRDVLAEEYPHLFDTPGGPVDNPDGAPRQLRLSDQNDPADEHAADQFSDANSTAAGQYARLNSPPSGQFSDENVQPAVETAARTDLPNPRDAASEREHALKGFDKGVGEGGNTRARTSPAPAPSPTPEEPKGPRKPAAGENPIGETDLRTLAATLPGADRQTLNVLEPLARSVPEHTLRNLAEHARSKRNPVGWLVTRLRSVVAEQRGEHIDRFHDPEPIERLPLDQALEQNVQQLAQNGHPWNVVADVIRDGFPDADLDHARAIYDDHADPEPSAAA